jgi:hypothetical protein
MSDKKNSEDSKKSLLKIQKIKTFSEGQIKEKPIIDKASVAPPPSTKPKK